VAEQVGLTFLSMATAGTAIGGFLHVMRMSLGYDPANVLQLSIRLHVQDPGEWSRIQAREARTAYIEQILEKIASVPEVSTVAVGGGTMPPYPDTKSSFELDGSRYREQPRARVMLVDQRYFAALRIRLLQGRVWNADENARGDFIAVVNHAFATRYLSSSDALNRRLRIPPLARGRYVAISAQSTAWRRII